jgi:hypothetical protein
MRGPRSHSTCGQRTFAGRKILINFILPQLENIYIVQLVTLIIVFHSLLTTKQFALNNTRISAQRLNGKASTMHLFPLNTGGTVLTTYIYSGYGGETDVSLNCCSFYGPIVVPGWEWMSEWMNEWVKELFFFNFRKFGAHGGMILTEENRRTRRKTCPSATSFTINPTGLIRTRNQAAAVRGRRLTAWAMARPFWQLNIFVRPRAQFLVSNVQCGFLRL